MADVDVRVSPRGDGYVAHVTVRDRATTRHTVRVSPEELARYGRARAGGGSEAYVDPRAMPGSRSDPGGEDVADLVRRSFEFLLAREPNTSILGEFDLSVIERYFPEYAEVIHG